MGWYGQQKRFGEKNIDAIIRREFSAEHLQVVDHASRKFDSEHYLAVKIGEQVVAFVVLTRENRGFLDIKVMDESFLPYYYDAPKRLLNKLTPTECKNSLEWRNECLSKFSDAMAKKIITLILK